MWWWWFAQELHNLLRGYHKCTVDEASKLAAYIFRVRFNDDKSKLDSIPYVLSFFCIFRSCAMKGGITTGLPVSRNYYSVC